MPPRARARPAAAAARDVSQIDNIQTNVESASQRVHRGVGELQTAAKSQRRYRRKLCTLLLLGAIAIVVLIAVLKFALKAAMPF